MFDMHCHILPAIDDGSKSWEESLAMARQAVDNEITGILATPHFSPDLKAETVNDLVKEFNEYLNSNELPLTVYPGMEVSLDPEIPAWLKGNRLVTIGRKHLLVELPFNSLPLYTEQVLFEVMLAGYTVILAHPERNIKVMEDPGLVFEWVSKGVLVQVNSGSVLGKFGPQVQQTVESLLRANLVHFLGTDAHSTRRRSSDFEEAVQVLTKSGYAIKDLCKNNGEQLISGEFTAQQDFSLPEIGKKPWWKKVLG